MGEGICEYFSECEFYNKYCKEIPRRDKITIFHEYISVYCYGPMRPFCHRWVTRHTIGQNEPADITPSGVRYTFSQPNWYEIRP